MLFFALATFYKWYSNDDSNHSQSDPDGWGNTLLGEEQKKTPVDEVVE